MVDVVYSYDPYGYVRIDVARPSSADVASAFAGSKDLRDTAADAASDAQLRETINVNAFRLQRDHNDAVEQLRNDPTNMNLREKVSAYRDEISSLADTAPIAGGGFGELFEDALSNTAEAGFSSVARGVIKELEQQAREAGFSQTQINSYMDSFIRYANSNSQNLFPENIGNVQDSIGQPDLLGSPRYIEYLINSLFLNNISISTPPGIPPARKRPIGWATVSAVSSSRRWWFAGI
ncbi:hypothetical protein QTO30_14530 [Yoonia sp. GPGPB17]|uniref:hypothetical protein n=1 Tax=Yoonia sp. GPGPB17 TaxID=3026147 RepID=UPI0030BEA7E9